MTLPASFRRIAKTALILVYLVILAGAVVRMTGSGMGCPDWPKCFGYYIPPTQEEDLLWQPVKDYRAGQVIILNESLLVAKENFVSDISFNAGNWEPYTKHDYAVFNAFHTWTEFLNRVLGALAGLATLVLAVLSLRYWKKNKAVPVVAWLVVFGMGFQAWLGATVVYSVLSPVKITLHMLMALVIVALLLYLVKLSSDRQRGHRYHQPMFVLLALALMLTMVQIFMGAQVRELVDGQVKLWGDTDKSRWLDEGWLVFMVHRTFSLMVLAVNGILAFRIWKLTLGFTKIYWVLGIIGLEIVTGVAMTYLEFPFASQPLHLILATILFGIQTYLVLEFSQARRSLKTL